MRILNRRRKDITDLEKSEIYYKAIDKYDYYIIKKLILDEGLSYIVKYPKLLKMVVEASEKTTNVYADYIAAKVYESEEYSSSINVTYSLEKAYAKYKKIENIKDEREKTIIIMRYGLYDTEPFTQIEIAEILDISRSYVSRIEKKVIEKLRNKLTDNKIQNNHQTKS